MRRSQPNRWKDALHRLKRWLLGKPEPPDADPYAYAGAPKKPRPPHLSASAVADLPDPGADEAGGFGGAGNVR